MNFINIVRCVLSAKKNNYDDLLKLLGGIRVDKFLKFISKQKNKHKDMYPWEYKKDLLKKEYYKNIK